MQAGCQRANWFLIAAHKTIWIKKNVVKSFQEKLEKKIKDEAFAIFSNSPSRTRKSAKMNNSLKVRII